MALKILFSKGSRGRSELAEYLLELNKRAATSKQDKGLLKKIYFHIDLLEDFDTRNDIGKHQVKRLNDELWEIRPGNVRILFSVQGDTVVLLNYFFKKTDKTPPKELKKGTRLLKKWREEQE